jgi:transposase-like protein
MASRSRRKITPELKAEAVEMVKAAGGNIAQVPRESRIYDSTLGNWVRDARERAEGTPTVEERAEIRELKRELQRVKRERDILGKAVAYFSASEPRNGFWRSTRSALSSGPTRPMTGPSLRCAAPLRCPAPELSQAFTMLTPGRQRSYVFALNSAKTSATKLARIIRYRDKILAGKGALER